MHTSGAINGILPDWYLIERETEKTIDKLNSIKELNYYIGNTDEFIRRLAILRLKKLGLKESGTMLKEIMDDPVESHANKRIAAWALKSLLVGSDSDYMINSRYLANFTGREKYEELFTIVTEQEAGSIKLQFSSSKYFSFFRINDEDSILEKDIFFEANFDTRKWLEDLRTGFKASIRKFLPSILKLLKTSVIHLWNGIRAAAAFLSKLKFKRDSSLYSENTLKADIRPDKKRRAKGLNNITENHSVIEGENIDILKRMSNVGHSQNVTAKMRREEDYLYDYSRIRKELYDRPSFFACVKKGVFQLFYILFYPLRFALKHKVAMICILLSIYTFLAYFSYGRAITNKYAGFDIQEVQSQLFRKAETIYYQAVNEFNRITGINEWKENNENKQASGDILKTASAPLPTDQSSGGEEAELYIVTAKDGLNIRIAPDPTSEKVGNFSLPYGSSVTLISSDSSKSGGIEWFYVEAEDGRVGWVSSKYLKKGEGR